MIGLVVIVPWEKRKLVPIIGDRAKQAAFVALSDQMWAEIVAQKTRSAIPLFRVSDI